MIHGITRVISDSQRKRLLYIYTILYLYNFIQRRIRKLYGKDVSLEIYKHLRNYGAFQLQSLDTFVHTATQIAFQLLVIINTTLHIYSAENCVSLCFLDNYCY